MKLLIGMAAAALFAAPAFADSVTYAEDFGTTQFTTGFTAFATHGDEMDGMRVTVFFSDGSSDFGDWGDLGSDLGGTTGVGGLFSMQMSGDTFGDDAFGDDFWTLNNTSNKTMTSFTIDGKPGRTVFDRVFDDNIGTIGSAAGEDFYTSNTPAAGGLSILVTYRDRVALGANPPVGDVFRLLDVKFTNDGFFAAGSTMLFVQDTDNVTSDLTTVPEPATLALLAFGMGGAALRRRRNKGRATA